PYILHAVRKKLHKELRPRFDSHDFVQDVWASFFADLPQERDFHGPENLINFLTQIAKNKVGMAVRQRLVLQKNNVNREQSLHNRGLDDRENLVASDPTPSALAIGREEWERLLQAQPPVYRRILILVR